MEHQEIQPRTMNCAAASFSCKLIFLLRFTQVITEVSSAASTLFTADLSETKTLMYHHLSISERMGSYCVRMVSILCWMQSAPGKDNRTQQDGQKLI